MLNIDALQALGLPTHEQLADWLQGPLANLNLVTRQEFDIQVQVLQKTRLKLEALEARVAELEQLKPAPEKP